jgi:hypothetical protein
LVRFARCNPDGHEGEPVKTRCTLLLVVENRLEKKQTCSCKSVFSRLIFARNLFNVK